ncbi:methyl-accepting chemotaxis protein [Marinobacterium sp. D7]|uniref:methyl-accepting chemotaxis protein n=1 Tax=Marinobacterium ramblicola TaxID=2849041 RepID=UPI001C2DE77D|nr:methyl-accepting chemotaxis protein [Marinobacterium ramblicola]MBV1787252.1 methyl-accepting chemotaxis protein [Marinobacterium ramblicola]
MKLKFAHKILTLALLPLILLTLLLVSLSISDMSTSRSLERLEHFAQLATYNSALVHELQKERGTTSGWLGSGDQAFADKLNSQRRLTDQALKRWRDYRLLLENREPKIDATLKKIDDQLRQLSTIRRDADARSIELKGALGYYTGLNKELLSIAGELSNISTSADLSRTASAFFAFLQAKERAGIERAVLSNTFAADQFAPGMFARFLTLVSEQNTYLSQFDVTAPPALKQQWRTLSQQTAFAEVEERRSIAVEKADQGGFGISATEWFERATARIDLMTEMEDSIGTALVEQAKIDLGTAQLHMWIELAMLISALTLVGGLSLRICHTVNRQVRSLSLTMGKVRNDHDLSVRAEPLSSDELGDVALALNHTLEGFASAIREVTDASRLLSQEARNTRQTVQQTENSLKVQSAETVQVAAAIEEVSTAIADVADSTSNASDVARSANELAAVGHNRMKSAFGAIQQLGEDIARVSDITAELRGSSDTISQVIDVINAISEQTNLLALNAAIEAARAGEQGRGFSVVADEVRTLAQKTHASTAQIEEIIKGLQAQTEDASRLMEENRRDMASTTEQIRDVSEALDNIVNAVDNITSLSTQIAAAAEEESAAMNDIGRSIATIDDSAETISQHARDLSLQAEQQAAMAEQLEQLISRFRV